MNKKKIVIPIIIILVIAFILLVTKTSIKNENATIQKTGASTNLEHYSYTVTASELITNKTDETSIKSNTEHLQNLIDEVSNLGGGLVKIPAGTYYFAPQCANSRRIEEYVIKCKSNVTIEGSGTDETQENKNTILKPFGETTLVAQGGIDMFYFNDYSDYNQEIYLENANFRNFIIDGQEATGKVYNSSGKGFMINLFKNCEWQNIKVLNTDGTGFGMDCPINSTIKNCIAINCGKAVKTKEDPGGSGFGIGTGYSNEESIHIVDCTALGNKKYGIFFEHQSRFTKDATKYPAVRAESFVVSNCKASGNLYDFGAIRGNDVTYENCLSDSSYTNEEVTNITNFKFENMSRRIHLTNCKTEIKFTDIEETDYYYDAVIWAMDNAILNEDIKTTFEPLGKITRAQVINMLWNMEGMQGDVVIGSNGTIGEDLYEDVSNKYKYADSIKWAKQEEIINDGSEFLPDNNCNRGDFITFLWKYAGSPEVSVEHEFSDVQEGSECEKAVNWAISKGITNGSGNGIFSPNEELVRKDIVTFLYRYAKGTNNFNIIYNLFGGEISQTNQTTYQAGMSEFTLNNPTKNGYTFLGWTGSNITENGYLGENNYKPQKIVTISTKDTGNKVFTANWMVDDDEENNDEEDNDEEKTLEIDTDVYKIENLQILKVKANTTIKEFKLNINTNATEVKAYKYNSEDEVLSDDELVSTGMNINFIYQDDSKLFTISVLGDVNGDGRADSSDMIVLNRYRLKKINLDGVFLKSGDFNDDGCVDIKDIVGINRFRLNKMKK